MSIFPVDATWIVAGDAPPVPPTATGATSGTPGFFTPSGATAPADFAALSAITANPTSAWLAGEYVRLADNSLAHWNGSAWAVGPAGGTPGTGKLPIDYATPGWAPEWMVGRDEIDQWNTARAQDAAARYDVLAANGPHLTQWIPTMRAVNPQLQVLVYQLGPFASITDAGRTAATSWPEAWFAHSSLPMVAPNWSAIASATAGGMNIVDAMRLHKGNRIMTEEPFKTFLMDAGNADWREFAADRAVAAAGRWGYHGVLLDSMGIGAINPGYVDAAPVNPLTGSRYVGSDWIAASSLQVREVRSRANFFVMINGLGNHSAYATTKFLGYEADLAMPERWLREPHASATNFPSAATLKASVDMIVDREAYGPGGIGTCTKLWMTPNTTPALQEQWFQYTQAAFYLGTNGESRMFFIRDGNTPAATGGAGGSPLWLQWSPQQSIGTPSGAYSVVGGVYQRTYTNGFVAVNPTTATVNVTLPAGTYTRSDTGATVTGTLSLATNRGVVLDKV